MFHQNPLSVLLPPVGQHRLHNSPSLDLNEPANVRWITSNVVYDRYDKCIFNRSAMIVFCPKSIRSRCLFYLSFQSPLLPRHLLDQEDLIRGGKEDIDEGGGSVGMERKGVEG